MDGQRATLTTDANSTTGGNGTIVPSTGVTLPNDVLEKVYQSYSLKQKRAGLKCFLIASVLFDLWAILIPQGQRWECTAVLSVFLVANILLAALLRLCGTSKFHTIKVATWEIAPHAAWLIAIKQLTLELILRGTVTPRDSLGWAVLLNFLVYITLPVFLKYIGILFGLGSFTIYICAVIGLSQKKNHFWEQIVADIFLLSAAAGIGLLCYFLGEAKQRRAFLEAKQSLEVKMVIEEQSAEQERLLLSVLPEHVAVKMRQDLGSEASEPFKKIYMSRHENVSILYADIVGFTAISSTYSASELVKILNELFARFDRLAEKYEQLRIKILGDCYYCISGAPVERPDHAVLCVHMGLSMVKAIQYVQQKTNSPVDMRVGIHTGAILAGILGQRQWQFDVYSKDVVLANKMESSGKAGFVHISDKTLSFLSGEFEVEPAYGERNEEALRNAGLKTYFITKVLKPFEDNKKKMGDTNGTSTTETKVDIETDTPSDLENESKCASPNGDKEEEAQHGNEADEASENFKQRLRLELVARDGHEELSKSVTPFLTFKDPNLESAYSVYREPGSTIPMIGPLLVQVVALLYTMIVFPMTSTHMLILASSLAIITINVLLAVAENFPSIFSPHLTAFSVKFNDWIWLRRSAAIIVVLFLGISNALDMYTSMPNIHIEFDHRNFTNTTHDYPSLPLYPSYFSNYAVLILISTTILSQLSHISKTFLMILITGVHCYLNIVPLEVSFRLEELTSSLNVETPLRIKLSILLIAVTVALCILARHLERSDRVIFMWKAEVSDQKEKASDMRRRNEALIYNVLPVHVAEHFMRNKKRSYDELYSQSYAEVGVLFASMPNFSDFYSEETVNNQGLECLRFLNEVISDFDALLELPKFQDIIKIKTIGSTYMAASGLNPTKAFKPDDPITTRWEHLSNLVEFALELKKALQGINEQSFNHFVLKMGVNHGPITAGVIGARKPHYDIWGNTVNVSSRMESTGKPGALQVVQETKDILEQFGFTFIERGIVMVKGKGELLTFYLQGKGTPPQPKPAAIADSPAHPITSASSSTASPNSVRLNQNYIEAEHKHEAQNRAPPNDATKDEAEPLLLASHNSTNNVNHNHIGEKQTLIDDEN